MRFRPVERYEFEQLGRYNAEVGRGIVHTSEWDERMRAEQARFEAAQVAKMEASGAVQIGDGLWRLSA